AATAGFDADEGHAILDERVEHAGGVAPSANAGDDDIGQPAELIEALAARLPANNALEIANKHREGVRADDTAEDVVRYRDRGHPVAHGLVDGVAKGSAAGANGNNLGAEGFHLEDVEFLAANVFLTHVNLTRQAKESASGGGGHAVLTGTCFG